MTHTRYRLHLPLCHNFTNQALSSLATSCPALISLDLSGCRQVNDDGLLPILQNCLGLKTLRVGGCQALTDRFLLLGLGHHPGGIKRIRGSNNNNKDGHFLCLTELDASHLPRITDKGLRCLIESQEGLVHLSLEGCTGITGQAFCHEAVLTSANVLQRNLKSLNLSFCPALIPNVIHW